MPPPFAKLRVQNSELGKGRHAGREVYAEEQSDEVSPCAPTESDSLASRRYSQTRQSSLTLRFTMVNPERGRRMTRHFLYILWKKRQTFPNSRCAD